MPESAKSKDPADAFAVPGIRVRFAEGGGAQEMDSDKQWRIDNAKRLQGQRLILRPYRAWSKEWDHDHCAACWAKFTELEASDSETEGYATGPDYPKGAGYEWVCRQCFADLKNEMKWTAVGR